MFPEMFFHDEIIAFPLRTSWHNRSLTNWLNVARPRKLVIYKTATRPACDQATRSEICDVFCCRRRRRRCCC